jgi:hypothetical protein
MRGRMDDRKSYSKPMEIGEVMAGGETGAQVVLNQIVILRCELLHVSRLLEAEPMSCKSFRPLLRRVSFI